MSSHWFSFRQGDRSEYLAHYMLSALGLAVRVPREEDIGIDFHCTLARHDGPRITYFAPYNVQVKSASVATIDYGGADRKGDWREDSVRWILNQKTPFFIAMVDKASGKMDLFTTATRWFAVHNGRIPYEIKLKPYTPKSDQHLGNGIKTELKVDVPADVEPVSWEIPLGQPALSMDFDKAEDQSFLLSVRNQFKDYINLDASNAVHASSGLQHFSWPLVINTNGTLRERGISVGWTSGPTSQTHQQLRALAPLVATLIRTYESVGDQGKVEKLGTLLEILPEDGDLNLVRQIIKDGIDMQAAKGKKLDQNALAGEGPRELDLVEGDQSEPQA